MADEKKADEAAEAAKPAAKKSTSASTGGKTAAKKPAATSSTAKSSTAKTSTAKSGTAKASAASKSGTSSAKSSSAASASSAKTGAAKTSAAKSGSAKAGSAEATDAVKPAVLKVHHLRPAAGARKDRIRVGRGDGSKGKTSGRGTKGTKARYQVRPGFEGGQLPFHMRSPKLRGFKNPFRVEYQVVNLDKLAQLYPSGGDVTVSDLVAKGAVRKNEKVKVLGTGDLSVKLNVTVDKVSQSAHDKIVAAGGSVSQS